MEGWVTNWAQDRDGCLNNVTRKFGVRKKERRGLEGRLAIRVSARAVQSKCLNLDRRPSRICVGNLLIILG
jgi:hypothetical protein